MIDLQVNGLSIDGGRLRCSFWEAPRHKDIKRLCEHLYNKGIQQILATLITDSYENILYALKDIDAYKKHFDNNPQEANSSQRAHIAGVHIEGGLISRFGIHNGDYAKEFDFIKVAKLKKECPGLIKLWTLCPITDTDGDCTKVLQDSGIYVSYGHTNANFEQAMQAFDKFKVKLVTHWGNAMPIYKGFDHRNPMAQDINYLDTVEPGRMVDPDHLGIGYAAYIREDVTPMLICGSEEDQDLHIHPRLAKKLIQKKEGKVILVSDSVVKSEYADNKLRGGLADLSKHFDNVLKLGFSRDEVRQMVEENPAKILNSTL